LYESTYEDDILFDSFEAFERKHGIWEHAVVENVNVKDFIKDIDELLNMTNYMIVNEIKNKSYFNGSTFAFERIVKALKRDRDNVIGQTSSIYDYMAMLFELRKMGKKLLSNGKVEDAMRMACVNEEINDINDIIANLRKAKIKPAQSLPFTIPKPTFDNFDELCSCASCCYRWLTNCHNSKQHWWFVINNV
jgi:hypothetical protein